MQPQDPPDSDLPGAGGDLLAVPPDMAGGAGALGPWNMGVLWVIIRGWGLGAQETTGGIALYGVFDQLSRLGMGIVGAVILLVAEGQGSVDEIEGDAVIALGVISLVLFVVATGL